MVTALEKAARALALSFSNAQNGDDWESWVPEVRAVLMAVREPGEAAIKAGIDLRRCNGGLWWEGDLADTWPAMIDAILSEGEK